MLLVVVVFTWALSRQRMLRVLSSALGPTGRRVIGRRAILA
jgi:hypothetical protein